MKLAALAFASLFILFTVAFSASYQGVDFTAPAGWKSEPAEGAMGFVPSDVTPETATVLVVGPAESLSGQSFESWLEKKLSDDLLGGAKLLQTSEITTQKQENTTRATLARVIQDAEGIATIRLYHAVTDGRNATIALAMSVSEDAAGKYTGAIRSFFESMMISGSSPRPFQSTATGITGKGERVPEAAMISGTPHGMFVGRSLLTGKSVCLLFLSGGRITRAIPEGGLDSFDWAKHQANHSGDCGKWEMSNSKLRINWGDGGTHEGPLTVTSNGIEFYGKRYAKPSSVQVSALAGRWESSRGTAQWGGEGINQTHTLTIGADGSFHWEAGGGGVVSGRAVYQETRNLNGKLQIAGSTMIFHGEDGSVESYTFAPVPGDPIVAFSLGSNMFTRVQEQ